MSTRSAIDVVARRAYGKLLASLAVRTRDIASAEDALSEAFLAALTQWSEDSVPNNPEAWLLTVARNNAVDAVRRRDARHQASEELVRMVAVADCDQQDLPDERFALLFACAHPAMDEVVRTPLILQCVLGFDADTISNAFIVNPKTMSQRLVRAKRKLRDSGVQFTLPEPEQLSERLGFVLESIYAAFSLNWDASKSSSGTRSERSDFAEESVALARLTARKFPGQAEAHGLLALILFLHSRRDARRDHAARFIPFSEQLPAAWDMDMVEEAEASLRRTADFQEPSRYSLEAAIQSAHVAGRLKGETDWRRIIGLYDVLLAIAGSVGAAVSRAAAVGELNGPQAGLEALDAATESLSETQRARYQPAWAVRAHLLSELQQRDEARDAYLRAAALSNDPSVKAWLEEKAHAL